MRRLSSTSDDLIHRRLDDSHESFLAEAKGGHPLSTRCSRAVDQGLQMPTQAGMRLIFTTDRRVRASSRKATPVSAPPRAMMRGFVTCLPSPRYTLIEQPRLLRLAFPQPLRAPYPSGDFPRETICGCKFSGPPSFVQPLYLADYFLELISGLEQIQPLLLHGIVRRPAGVNLSRSATRAPCPRPVGFQESVLAGHLAAKHAIVDVDRIAHRGRDHRLLLVRVSSSIGVFLDHAQPAPGEKPHEAGQYHRENDPTRNPQPEPDFNRRIFESPQKSIHHFFTDLQCLLGLSLFFCLRRDRGCRALQLTRPTSKKPKAQFKRAHLYPR